MKLTKLTSEQKIHLKANKDKFVKKFLRYEKINRASAIKSIEFIYSLIKRPLPTIYEASNPLAAQRLANKLKGTNKTFYAFGTFLTAYWASFYAYYETWVDFNIITEDKFHKYFKLRKFIESNIFLTIEFERAIIVVEKPIACLKNQNGMHCTTGPAIKWRDGYGQYYVNGRCVPRQQYLMALSGEITKEIWLSEKNEDIKAAWFEILGAEKLINILGAKEIDSIMHIHANGELDDLRLYKTPFSLPEIGEPLAWVKFICPSTGSNYLISVNPKHNKVMDAVLDTTPFYGKEIKTADQYSFAARG